ncbi:hypothetical protein [Nocardiopsis potens]|uniref:hypothetical protein n=1 Tax=Nocardiopsis potens TaxID=1246458 RepID=UPI00034DA7EE|nr:hypothetical protein [Nocardiopsis potens]
MESEGFDVGRASAVTVLPPAKPRKLAKVPFVELADGRLQGVVSSGSDIARVYVSSFTAGTHTFSCGTNNNRPCGGLGGFPCKHLQALLTEAVSQYGLRRVTDYLKIQVEEDAGPYDMARAFGGGPVREESGAVFNRFLRYLSYLELPGATAPLPEMHWFPATGAMS